MNEENNFNQNKDEKNSNSEEINDINLEKEEEDFSFDNINIQKWLSPRKYDAKIEARFIEINQFLLSPINENIKE